MFPPDSPRAARLEVHQVRYLERCGFPLSATEGRGAGAHRRYSQLDVVRLAVAGRLISCGLAVAEAAHVVGETVGAALFAPATCGLTLPTTVIRMRLDGMVAYVVPRTGGLPAVQVGHFYSQAEAALVIQVGDIAGDALQRLGQRTPGRMSAGTAGHSVRPDPETGDSASTVWSSPAPFNTAATADKGTTP